MPDDTHNAIRRGRQRRPLPAIVMSAPVPNVVAAPALPAPQPEPVVIAAPVQQPKPDKTEAENARITAITRDAMEAYNRLLARPEGLLPKVMAVGMTTRVANVRRVIPTASDICRELYGSKRITPQFWDDYFTSCSRDDFAAGRGPYSDSHGNWTPDFEFLTRPKTMLRIFEKAISK